MFCFLFFFCLNSGLCPLTNLQKQFITFSLLQYTTPTRVCTLMFRAFQGIWYHIALVLNQNLTVYHNGAEVTKFLKNICIPRIVARRAKRVTHGGKRLTFGENSFPIAEYDELIFWNRRLTADEIKQLYGYYKGRYFS